MSILRLRGAVATAALASVAFPASAGFVDLGGGWQALWDDSLDDQVMITPLGVVDDAIFIRKEAIFTQGSSGGVFPSIPIVFMQTEFGAARHIVIEDEIITNSTGEDWGGFRFQLVDSGNAIFDPVATMGSGGGGPIGFTIDPFTTGTFSDGDVRLEVGGGTLADGATWLPGAGAEGGQLWIDVFPAVEEPFTVFTLKETPLLPGPASLGVMALAALGCTRRRR